MIRYNRLLSVIHSSLKDLKKALKGLVVMSQSLETMFNSLYNNLVPEMWAAKVTQTKTMYSWNHTGQDNTVLWPIWYHCYGVLYFGIVIIKFWFVK